MRTFIELYTYFGHFVFWIALACTAVYYEEITWTGMAIACLVFMIYYLTLKLLDRYEKYKGWW